MKKKFKITAFITTLLLTMCIGTSVPAASISSSGPLGKSRWRISLSVIGNTITGTTSYDAYQRTRRVSVTGKYIGSSFQGQRTLSGSAGDYKGEVKVILKTPRDSDRIVSAKGVHRIESITRYTNINYR